MRYALVLAFGIVGPDGLGQGTASPDPAPAAPPQILEYYRSHNFVTAFSTPRERQTLAASGAEPTDRRLSRVARLLRQLEQQGLPFDPGMTRSSRSAGALGYRSELLRITTIWSEHDGAVWVNLEALSIGPADRTLFVSRFDELSEGDRVPDLDELLRIRSSAAMLSAPERHLWHRVGAEWRRAAMTMFFIAY